jgi:hypothetical protein
LGTVAFASEGQQDHQGIGLFGPVTSGIGFQFPNKFGQYGDVVEIDITMEQGRVMWTVRCVRSSSTHIACKYR